MDYNAGMETDPAKKKLDGPVTVPVAEVNPEDLPSDAFLAQLTAMIAKSGRVTQIVYKADTEEIIELKEI